MSDLKVGDLVRDILPQSKFFGERGTVISIHLDTDLLYGSEVVFHGTVYHVELINGVKHFHGRLIGYRRIQLQKIEDDGERKVSSWDDCIWKPADLKITDDFKKVIEEIEKAA